MFWKISKSPRCSIVIAIVSHVNRAKVVMPAKAGIQFFDRVLAKLMLMTLFIPTVTLAADITKIDVSNTVTSARLTLKLNKTTPYRVYPLTNPDRLIIDLTNAQLKANIANIKPLPTFTQCIRAHRDHGILHIVLETTRPVLAKTAAYKSQLIIDMYVNHKAKTSEIPVKKTLIVIDAGHGGKDTGAIGENNTREKNIVLAVSKRLAKLINRQPNLHAVLTRNGDYFVPLRQRLRLARKDKADLFVAIHADAFLNNNASGASVYTLSQRGATSEAALWLAKRDNFSELSAVDLNELEDQSHRLRSVLIDLAQTATISDSLRLGTSLLEALENVNRLHYPRVEQAPFVVLKSPDIPSVLVEVGFISNPKEESRLREASYQNKLALALLNGIQKYVNRYQFAYTKTNSLSGQPNCRG